jgi:MFS family permease
MLAMPLGGWTRPAAAVTIGTHLRPEAARAAARSGSPPLAAVDAPPAEPPAVEGLFAPLKHGAFRGIWIASLLSNLGGLIQGVGAAWIMTQLTRDAGLVAMVQSAQMGPVLVFAIAAGAIADMYDRRKVAMIAVAIAFAGAAALALICLLGLVSPAVLLVSCLVIGSGNALLWPAWQASVSEQVPQKSLPGAIALNSISFNIARSFGPAIGGLIVAAFGGAAAFAATAASYLPLFAMLFRWKRVQEPARLPPEGMGRAIVSGVRYVFHSPPIRVVLIRTLATGLVGAALSALLPLVAREVLHGTAPTFGLLLGAFGIGAVCGATVISRLRRRFTPGALAGVATVTVGAATAVVGFSTLLPLTLAALLVAGCSWMLTMNEYNVALQTYAPRWVAGRALATFQAAIAGGMAIGAWIWGQVAQDLGVPTALKISAALLAAMPLLGVWLRLAPRSDGVQDAIDPPAEIEVALALTPRSGPIRIEIVYSVPPEQARGFYGLMQQIRGVRSRSGGYGWSLSRDIAQPDVWLESYSCPTWLDYLRQRTRVTQADRELQASVQAFLYPDAPITVRRWLERPFGSVRWKDDSPDRESPGVSPL